MKTRTDKTKGNKIQSNAKVAKRQAGHKPTFQFVVNRPEAIAQRKVQEMVNTSSRVAQLHAFQEMVDNSQNKQGTPLTTATNNHAVLQRQPFQNRKVTNNVIQRQIANGLLAGTIVYTRDGVRGTIHRECSDRIHYIVILSNGNRGPIPRSDLFTSHQSPSGRTHPLGFRSDRHFRDATRGVAQGNRGSVIAVSGSSVTGRSGDGKRDFRPARAPFVWPRRGVPKHTSFSDIDVGIIGRDAMGRRGLDHRGFPQRGTSAEREEQDFQKRVRRASGHPSGLRRFPAFPKNRDDSERTWIMREHTPDREDRGSDSEEDRGRSRGRSRRSEDNSRSRSRSRRRYRRRRDDRSRGRSRRPYARGRDDRRRRDDRSSSGSRSRSRSRRKRRDRRKD